MKVLFYIKLVCRAKKVGNAPLGHYNRCVWPKRYSLLVVHTDWAAGQLHHRALQLHGDLADGGMIIHHLPPHLDVEILIAAPTLWGQQVVAGGGQLEGVSIKRLEVVVPPCAADSFIMCWARSCWSIKNPGMNYPVSTENYSYPLWIIQYLQRIIQCPLWIVQYLL